MKKLLITAIAIMTLNAGFAQSEKYMNTMKEKIAALDTTMDPAALQSLSAAFERIADAEKTQWQPYYYAALASASSGTYMAGGQLNGGMTDKLDPLADRAEMLLKKADALSPNNSEIYIVKKMIATVRLMGDPMSRYMQYGPEGAEALATAKKLNPENPRVYLLEGQDKYFTPEQFGGSKTEAKQLFETANQKFEQFKPATPVDPTWGKRSNMYFLSQVKS